MNADFFHPTWEGRKCVTVIYDRIDSLDGYWDGAELRDAVDIDSHHQPGQGITDGVGDNSLGDEMNQIAYRESEASFAWAMANPGPQRRLSLPNLSNGRARHPRSIAYHPSLRRGAPSTSSPASDARLDIYSCATVNLKSDNELNSATSVAIGRMRSRYLRYQQRMDALLRNSFDGFSFQETSRRSLCFGNERTGSRRMYQLVQFLLPPPLQLRAVCYLGLVLWSSKFHAYWTLMQIYPHLTKWRERRNKREHSKIHMDKKYKLSININIES